MQVSSLIKPFLNISQFLAAMQIVQATFCVRKNNHDQVSDNINKLIGTDIDKQLILPFIQRIKAYPNTFGYDFLEHHQTLNNKLVDLCNSSGRPSKVLDCHLEYCMFCTDSNSSKLQIKSFKLNKDPILYSDYSIERCFVNTKQCPTCLSQHFISYAINSKTNTKHFYLPSKQLYFHTSTESYFEIALLNRHLADVLFKCSSFKGFAKAYNYITANHLSKRSFLQYQRLIEGFFSYHLTIYYHEFFNQNLLIEMSTNNRTAPIDVALKTIKKSNLFLNFTQKWSRHQPLDEKCLQSITMDGNWKCWRPKCAFDGLVKRTSEFGDIPTGCTNSPTRNSYYCFDHRGNELSFKIDDKIMRINPENIKVSKLRKEETVTIICDSFVACDDTELYLCKTNTDHHKWFTYKQIPSEIVNKFKDERLNKNESCNTNKDNVYSCDLKSKTVGVQIACCNCGIIHSWKELYASESQAQVALFLTEINEQFNLANVAMAKKVIYDNGCNLAKYCHKRANESNRTNFFKEVTFIVDRLHIQGHVGKWCLENCHPKLFPELDGYNTQVCEQVNSWLSKYKYILKHMSVYRYNFFLYIIFNEYNKIKLEKKFELSEIQTFNNQKGIKRKFVTIDEHSTESAGSE